MDASILSSYGKSQFNKNDIEALYCAYTNSSDDDFNYFNYNELKLIEKTFSAIGDSENFFGAYLNNCYKIKRLGRDEDAQDKEDDVRRLGNAVKALITSEDSVGLIVRNGGGEVSVCIDGKNITPEKTTAPLKAWFGYAEIEKYDVRKIKAKFSGYASLIKLKDDNNAGEKVLSNWLSAVISANVKGNYTITVHSDRVKKIYIEKKLSELKELHKKLSALTDLTLNFNICKNKSNSTNEAPATLNLPRKTKELVIDKERTSESDGENISAALSQMSREPVIKALTELIEAKIQQLTYGLSDGIKNVAILCETEDYDDYRVLTSIISSAITRKNYLVSWEEYDNTDKNPCFAMELPNKNIPDIFYLPTEEFPGFERKKNEKLSVNPADSRGDMNFGNIYWNGTVTDVEFVIDSNKLNRHVSVFGMTGCGKSNTVFSILEQADVPFMVIEPVKSEYKILKEVYSDLQIHHMEPQKKGVLRINPFWFPPGGSLSFHMDAIKKIIGSAFSLYAAMPNILEQCIYNCYVKKGWNVVKNVNIYSGFAPEEFLYPTFSDLCDEIELYLKKSNFTGETLSTYQGALLSRLRSFTTGVKGVLLNTPDHPDFNSWINTRHVIELDGLADDADKSVVMGSLIMQYFQCVKQGKKIPNFLNHIIVVEEAHRLFKNSQEQTTNQEVAAPEAQLVETLSNMMAEIRAYGEGFIIVDQSPNRVAEVVVSNSSTKIIHRLDNKKDIEMIENSLIVKDMSPVISALTQGDAVVRTEGMEKPIKIRVGKSKIKDSATEYTYQNSDVGLDNASNVDFIMNNDGFTEDFTTLSERFINNLSYDDLTNSKMFFYAYIKELKRLLYLYGFSELTRGADKQFYLMLVNKGISKALQRQKTYTGLFALQMIMFSKRLCAILAEGDIKLNEIKAFTEFRADVLHEQFVIKNKNSGPQAQAIAMICGFYTIYTDIVLKLAALINDTDINFEDKNNLSIKFFDGLFKDHWSDIFVAPPSDAVKDNIILIMRSVYKVIINN